MAIGFTPKHTETIAVQNLNTQQILALIYATATQLNWQINYLSNNGIIAYTNNGTFTFNAEVTIKITGNDIVIESVSTGNEMFDWGRNKKTVLNFINQFNSLEASSLAEELTTQYEQLPLQVIDSTQDALSEDYIPDPMEQKNFLSLLIPSKEFFITPLIIDINIVLFLLMVLTGVNIMLPDTESLLSWGANFRPSTLGGQWWRLLSCCFLHIGVVHLLLNMYALLYIGVMLEPILGRTRYLAAYLLTGIGASVVSLWWHDLTVSAGASGAIFGMYGVFLALLTTNLIEKNARQQQMASIGIFVIYNLVYGLKGGVDNAAHIGGLVSGLLIGYVFIASLKKPYDGKLQKTSIAGAALIIIAVAAFALKTISNDIGIYEEKMKKFGVIEEKALKVYTLPEGTSNTQTLSIIKDSGIYYWNEGIKLINSTDKLDLPEKLKKQNLLFKEYCELRIASYELMYKAFAENTDAYKTQLEEFNTKVNDKINEISALSKEK